MLRGCVPKKLMALAGLFTEEMQDAESFGCVLSSPVSSGRDGNILQIISLASTELPLLNARKF